MELNKIQRIRDAMKGRHYANLIIRNNGKDIVIEMDDLLDILPSEHKCGEWSEEGRCLCGCGKRADGISTVKFEE